MRDDACRRKVIDGIVDGLKFHGWLLAKTSISRANASVVPERDPMSGIGCPAHLQASAAMCKSDGNEPVPSPTQYAGGHPGQDGSAHRCKFAEKARLHESPKLAQRRLLAPRFSANVPAKRLQSAFAELRTLRAEHAP